MTRHEAETIVLRSTKAQDRARTRALKAEPEGVRIDFLWAIVLAYASPIEAT